MRIQEVQHPNEPWLMYWLGNLLSIDSDYVRSVGIAWLYQEDGKWRFMPKITGNTALFYNSVFFIRYTTTPLVWGIAALLAWGVHLPLWIMLFGLFWSVRWSPSTTETSLWQAGCGFKLNGRFAPLFRFQSDDSSAAGVTGKNTGQATGFNFGTH